MASNVYIKNSTSQTCSRRKGYSSMMFTDPGSMIFRTIHVFMSIGGHVD
jgi:hypothetical protein